MSAPFGLLYFFNFLLTSTASQTPARGGRRSRAYLVILSLSWPNAGLKQRLLRSATHSNSAANAVNFLDPFQLVRKTADLTVNWQRVEELARNNLQSDSEKKPQRGGARLEWKIDECVADYVRKGLVALPQNAVRPLIRHLGLFWLHPHLSITLPSR